MSLFPNIRDAVYALTSCCFPNPSILINKRQFKVIQLLGEGGFSFVYLVQDVPTGRLFALKKIRCPAGSQTVADAMREMDMYRKFQHSNIIKVIDTAIMTDREATKIVYIFMPYFKRGNLQDSINANNLNQTYFPETELLRFFLKVCYAIRTLHSYQLPDVPAITLDGEPSSTPYPPMAPPAVSSTSQTQVHIIPNTFDKLAKTDDTTSTFVPYAHRDLKPGNVLITDDGQSPVLTGFGSLVRARIPIKNRKDAMLQQDIAAEKSTMSYRAPELHEVQPGTMLDEKVDIWSLGCTMYATAYGQNPFEAYTADVDGSIVLAVLNGQYKFPAQDPYTEGIRNLIQSMLVVNPEDRLDIHQVIASIDTLLEVASC